jgi:hypothetical protein
MSDSIGKPWIESAVTRTLAEHAQELPSPPKLRGRAQIVKVGSSLIRALGSQSDGGSSF